MVWSRVLTDRIPISIFRFFPIPIPIVHIKIIADPDHEKWSDPDHRSWTFLTRLNRGSIFNRESLDGIWMDSIIKRFEFYVQLIFYTCCMKNQLDKISKLFIVKCIIVGKKINMFAPFGCCVTHFKLKSIGVKFS